MSKRNAERARELAGQDSLASIAGSLFCYRANALLGKVVEWPSDKYKDDQVAFFREVLGVENVWSKQVEILEAVRDYKRIAVKSGHRISKSFTAAGVALWFFCCFEDARVIMTSVTARQVDQILWREVKRMHKRAKDLGIPIDGEPSVLARTGLVVGFREILGFTATEAEAIQGIAGANLFFIVDEASGVQDAIFEAIEGNRAGGARLFLTGNPTRNEGEFFDAFNSKSEFYKTLTVSSEESPNVVEGRTVIPGLAEREWIEEKKKEWGEESAIYKVRIKGEFALREDGRIISLHDISMAEMRWYDEKEDGRLFLGIDPAGAGDAGDETTIAVRRGKKIIRIYAFQGLDANEILAHARGIVTEYAHRREVPVINIDSNGPIGHEVLSTFQTHFRDKRDAEVFGIRGSDNAYREPSLYDTVRDELWANLHAWLRSGGSIPEDTKLTAELHAPEWRQVVRGILKATPKKDLKKALGRSPDRADAAALATWEPIATKIQAGKRRQEVEPEHDIPGVHADPYAGLNTWR